jgi:hypothetical protein
VASHAVVAITNAAPEPRRSLIEGDFSRRGKSVSVIASNPNVEKCANARKLCG